MACIAPPNPYAKIFPDRMHPKFSAGEQVLSKAGLDDTLECREPDPRAKSPVNAYFRLGF